MIGCPRRFHRRPSSLVIESNCYNEGMGSAKCIYCGRFFNPQRGKGDHILPGALFGEFEGDVRFRGVCSKCNNSFSPHEQILAQATPLGHLRGIVQPTRRGRQGGMRQRGAHGSKAPRFIAFAEDHGEIVHPHEDDPRNVSPVADSRFRTRTAASTTFSSSPG